VADTDPHKQPPTKEELAILRRRVEHAGPHWIDRTTVLRLITTAEKAARASDEQRSRARGQLTAADVRRRIQEVRALANKPEQAHACKDVLWLDVLRAIAAGAPKARALAAEAVKTAEITFSRWRA
jgi:hypothetical protein